MDKKIAVNPQAETATKNHNINDTSAAGQRQRVLAAIRTGPKTTIELREQYGVISPAPRVLELRRMGYVIHTLRVRAVTPDGVTHYGIARYVLVSEARAS